MKWTSDPEFIVGKIKKGDLLRVESGTARNELRDNKITVVSYNMGFAAGPMQNTLADEHPESFFTDNLDRIIAMLREQRADLVLLQEVDLNSKRSWYLNQLDYIMDRLGWEYAAPVVDWDLYFPLRKERKITKATVVLSRFPILSNEFVLTEAKPNFENRLLNIFYYPLLWKSCMQRVGVDLGGRVLDVYNVHLCVWSRSARMAQVQFLADWIKTNRNRDFIIGGDFNFQAYIRGTPVPEADMDKPPFFNVLWDRFEGISEILSEKGNSADELHRNFTFPEREHRYDFIFYSQELSLDDSKVVKGINSSDHLPVSAEFILEP